MAFQFNTVDWWGLAGSLCLVVPPIRMEARKLRIFLVELRAERTLQPGARPLWGILLQSMKNERDQWRFIDSLFLVAGGLMLAWSFLSNGFAA